MKMSGGNGGFDRRKFVAGSFGLLAAAKSALGQQGAYPDGNFAGGPITGPFRPNWESLKAYRYPDWFRDAKFGIWAHWSGPNLAQGDQIRGATNRHLLSVITDGVKGSDMPPSGLPSDKVWQIVAYLRNLTAVAFDSMAAGDVQAGSALFFGKAGCANCHKIRGRGGFPGPDLSNIGRVRSFRQLRESLLDPNAQIAEGYGGVTVTTKSGQTISGVARDNTNYAIQILDAL